MTGVHHLSHRGGHMLRVRVPTNLAIEAILE